MTVRSFAVAAVLAGSLALGGTALSGARSSSASVVDAPVAGAAGIGDPYFPQDGNGGYDVAHYTVRDTMRMSSGRLTGTTTIRARSTHALSRLNVDLLLRATSVSVDGRPAGFVKPNRHEVRINPAVPIAAGQAFTVRIAYRGFPGNHAPDGVRTWSPISAPVKPFGLHGYGFWIVWPCPRNVLYSCGRCAIWSRATMCR